MGHKAAIIPIHVIKDLFNAEKTDSVPQVDVIAFEAYGSPIALGRGYLGGKYSTEKVCIRMDFQGKVHYYHLDWIWAGGIYGSRFTGPSDVWEGEDLMKDIVDVHRLPSPRSSGDVEVRDLFDAIRSQRHCCALNAGKRGDDLLLTFTYAEQEDPAQGKALQTTIQCTMDSLALIKKKEARLNKASPP